MGWLASPLHLAVERAPASWTLVAAERAGDRAPRFVVAASFADAPASLSEEIRRFRVREHLPSSATLVLWPELGDAGVVALDSRASGVVTLPKARVIRQRVEPFVRAGGRVTEVLLPHEAALRLAGLAGWSSACVLLMQPSVACLAVIDGRAVRASYLGWLPPQPTSTETAKLLARYQLAARLMPYLREWAGQAPQARMAVCGRFPDLRAAMVPIVEELDREVDVLDAGLVPDFRDEIDPDETSGRQLAWAAAARPA